MCAEQGAGATALKTLVAYIKNIADNPAEEKFRNINTENKAFKSRVAPVVGAVNVLKARSMPDPCHPAWPHAYHVVSCLNSMLIRLLVHVLSVVGACRRWAS